MCAFPHRIVPRNPNLGWANGFLFAHQSGGQIKPAHPTSGHRCTDRFLGRVGWGEGVQNQTLIQEPGKSIGLIQSLLKDRAGLFGAATRRISHGQACADRGLRGWRRRRINPAR